MPHKFTDTGTDALEGVWYKFNGRRYCAWRFDPQTSTLQAKRGVVVHTATLESQTNSLEELRDLLPQEALKLANGESLH